MFVYSPTKQSGSQSAPVRRDDLRVHNTALIFRALWEAEDGAARIDLARRSGLSRATVSAIAAELLESGLVVEGNTRASRGGRPARVLRFHDTGRCLLGVELGASHISAVRTDLRGHVQHIERIEHNVQGDPEGTLHHLGEVLDTLRDTATAPLLGVGLAVPSPILHDRPGFLSPDLFPLWARIDVGRWVQERLGCPTLMDNDANLGALSEHWWGAGRGLSHFAYIKVATGVGSGVIINGDIYRGAGGIAGEIGHTAIDPSGPRCRCGLKGCLEALVGTQSLLERAREHGAQLDIAPGWATEPTLSGLITAARGGDPTARALIGRTGHWLGIAIANLLNLINPGRVILGGRLTQAGELLLEPLREAMASRALWSSVMESRVVVSALPGEPIALGAATLVLQAALSDPASTLLGGPSTATTTPWRLHA